VRVLIEERGRDDEGRERYRWGEKRVNEERESQLRLFVVGNWDPWCGNIEFCTNFNYFANLCI
jgi:hypothetical protein